MSKKVRLFATQRVTRKAKDGKDALQIIVEPDTLVFDTDENGLVNNSELSDKYAEIRCYRGNTDVTDLCRFFFEEGDNVNCNANVLVNRVSFTKINTQTIEGNEVSYSNGYVNITIKDESLNSHSVQIKFSVNITKFIGGQISDTKKLESKYAKLTAGMSEGSSIIQTAQNISLEVSSRNVGRRNMLKNSSFRKQEDVCITYQARIEKNTGIDGINCIRCVDTYSGSGDGNYLGAFWESAQNPSVYRNINIISGKDYIISCWIKSSDINVTFCIETFEMKSISASERGVAHRKDFKVKAANTWERVEFVIKASELKSDTQYLAVNFWCNNETAGSGVLTDSYICKPMMEEGDTYRGWTLSEDDYDYVGGNILDNTRSLEKSGNLEKEESEIINEGYEYAYAVAHSNNTTSADIEMLQWNVGGRIYDGQDYMFSFLAKGTGVVTTHLWKDGTPRFFVEGSNGKYNGVSPDGFIEFDLTNEWKRYWVHYHLTTSSGHPLPEKLLIRCKSGNDVYVCKPKLEVGATMTEYTERQTDLVDKASLKKAGIEITTDQVKLYGDKVQVLTRKDGETEYKQAGMFDNGKLNANLIDAINIVTQALQTGTIKAGDAVIENLKVTNADVSGKITATNGTVGNMVINNDSIGKIENSDGVVITKDSIICSRSDLYFTGDNKVIVSTQGDNLIYIQRKQTPTLGTLNLAPIIKISSKVGAIGTSSFRTQGTAVEIEGNIDIPEGNIYMENGSLVGSVRKTIYNINSNTDLDKGEYESGMILICDNSSDISLKLPSTNANHGDFFTMLKTGTGKVNVYGESYIPCRGGWREGNGWTCSTRYEHTHFLFDGYTWYSECTLDS